MNQINSFVTWEMGLTEPRSFRSRPKYQQYRQCFYTFFDDLHTSII